VSKTSLAPGTTHADAKRLADMRALGVVWPKGKLPRYPSTMTEVECNAADLLYDGMSPQFTDGMMRKR